MEVNNKTLKIKKEGQIFQNGTVKILNGTVRLQSRKYKPYGIIDLRKLNRKCFITRILNESTKKPLDLL